MGFPAAAPHFWNAADVDFRAQNVPTFSRSFAILFSTKKADFAQTRLSPSPHVLSDEYVLGELYFASCKIVISDRNGYVNSIVMDRDLKNGKMKDSEFDRYRGIGGS
jgi:hypothetical protein